MSPDSTAVATRTADNSGSEHAGGAPTPGDRLRAIWARPAAPWAAAALAYLLVALLLLRPGTITDCTGSVFGGPGDNTGGFIWLTWNLDQLGLGPFGGETPLAGYPAGTPLWQPHFVTWTAIFVPLWALAQVFGAVCGFNLMLLGGMVASGLAMFALVRWLTRNVAVALLAGAVFAFSPYEQVKALGHLNYVQIWVFPLALWAILALWREPTRRRAIVAGVAVAGAGYVDGYYLLLVPVFATGLLAGWIVGGARQSRDVLTERVRHTLVAAGVAGVLLAPVAFTLLTQGDEVSSAVERSETELHFYSARPWEFVLPSRFHPVWDGVLGPWQDRNLHGSNFAEQTLYLGAPVLVGAAGFVGWTLRRRRRGGDDDGGLAVRPGLLAGGVVAAVALAALFSLPPWVLVFGRRIPTPSGLLFDAAPLWRVVARFFIPISAGMVVLAASGLAVAVRRWQRAWLLPALLVPVVAFDFVGPAGFDRWSYADNTDPAYEWLEGQPAGTVIAEYPFIEEIHHSQHQWYQTFQQVHGRPVVNGAPWDDPYGRLTAGLGGLADPQTLPALRRIGVDYVLVHPGSFQGPVEPAETPEGLTPVFSEGAIRVYRVEPGPEATAVLGVRRSGWYRQENDGWTSRRWLFSDGELEAFVFPFSDGPLGDGRAQVCAGFAAASFAIPQTVTVAQGGDVLWRGEVASERTDIRFVASTGSPIDVVVEPGAVNVADYVEGAGDRVLSIEMSRLFASADTGRCPG